MRTQGRHIAISCLFAFGCADSAPGNDEPGDGTPKEVRPEPPAKPACPSYLPNRCGDDGACVSFDFDPDNCGACGNACGGWQSDHTCFNGECRCGFGGVECTEPAVCWKGLCVAPDVFGATCDPIEGLSCEPPLECVDGPDGGFCTLVDPATEVCNGRDDDKDGEIDEVSQTIRNCYDGQPETNYVGPCHQGYKVCIWNEFEQGYSECREQQLPIPEVGLLACDGIDNNCDGCVDGIAGKDKCLPGNPRMVDVCFAFDTSGSMGENNATVLDVATGFGAIYDTGDDAIKWCVVNFPGPGASTVLVHQDLTDYPTFVSALSTVYDGLGSDEGNWDAVYLMATDSLPISFRPGALRLYILITDEHGQTYYPSYPGTITEEVMCASLTDEIFATIASPENFGDFDDCGAAGSPFTLSTDTEEMIRNLEMIFTTPCQ